ncbi:MAG: hypothetical protein ACK5QU_07575 [Bacteroidota bacterium]
MKYLSKYILIICCILLSFAAKAQPGADKKEQIASLRVAFITKEFSLTSK